jgi:hypothetical protein
MSRISASGTAPTYPRLRAACGLTRAPWQPGAAGGPPHEEVLRSGLLGTHYHGAAMI